MKNADGYCYLDSPTTWNEVDIWMQHLYSDGTPLTKEVLLQKGVDGVNYLEQAARSGAFASLVRVLALQGEYLAAEDLLQPDGKPNGVLKAAVAWGQHGALFTLTQGKQHEAGHMQRLYRLLPPSARKEVAGFHALTQRLQEHFADKSEQQSR